MDIILLLVAAELTFHAGYFLIRRQLRQRRAR